MNWKTITVHGQKVTFELPTLEDALDSVLLKVEVRSKLRLGSHFETHWHKRGRWFVFSTFAKKKRLWVATRDAEGFNFEEADLEAGGTDERD